MTDRATTIGQITAATGLPSHAFYLCKMPVELQALAVSIGAIIALVSRRGITGDDMLAELRQLAELHPIHGEVSEVDWSGVLFSAWLQMAERSAEHQAPMGKPGGLDG